MARFIAVKRDSSASTLASELVAKAENLEMKKYRSVKRFVLQRGREQVVKGCKGKCKVTELA